MIATSILAFLIMLAATTAGQPLATSSPATLRSIQAGRLHRQQDAAPLEYG